MIPTKRMIWMHWGFALRGLAMWFANFGFVDLSFDVLVEKVGVVGSARVFNVGF